MAKSNMIQKQYFAIIITFFVVSISYGQNTKFKNEGGISIGYNWGAFKNLTLAPVSMYQYQSPVFEIHYLRYTKKNRIVELRYQHWKSELNSERIPALNLEYKSDLISLNVLYPVFDRNKWILHIGFFTQSAAHLYGGIIAGEVRQRLDFSTRIAYQINEKHLIISQLSIPVIFFVYGKLDTDLYLPDKYQGYIFNIEYQYALSNRLNLVSQFRSRYDRLQSENIYRELQSRISTGINLKF